MEEHGFYPYDRSHPWRLSWLRLVTNRRWRPLFWSVLRNYAWRAFLHLSWAASVLVLTCLTVLMLPWYIAALVIPVWLVLAYGVYLLGIDTHLFGRRARLAWEVNKACDQDEDLRRYVLDRAVFPRLRKPQMLH